MRPSSVVQEVIQRGHKAAKMGKYVPYLVDKKLKVDGESNSSLHLPAHPAMFIPIAALVLGSTILDELTLTTHQRFWGKVLPVSGLAAFA
jgi:hypothetical protein